MGYNTGNRIIGNDIITICNRDNPRHHSVAAAKGLVDVLEVFAIPPNSNRDDDDRIWAFQGFVLSLGFFQVFLHIMAIGTGDCHEIENHRIPSKFGHLEGSIFVGEIGLVCSSIEGWCQKIRCRLNIVTGTKTCRCRFKD